MFEDLKPHIADLRKRLVISSITVVIMFFACFSFYEPILEWMMVPVKHALPAGTSMIAVEIQETFFTAMKVAFFAGFILSLPVIFWQLWLFLAPGLYDHEKKLVIPFVFFATLMFLMGASFAYYIVVPIGFDFLIAFGNSVVSIAFELPVITFFLAKIGLVDDKMLKDFFRYAVVLIFIVAAILTPPDVISQILMAAPLLVLYGVSIYIAKIFNPAQKEEEEEE